MDIKYQRYMNRELFPGNDISINGTKWYCFGHCTLVGSTINISLPVVIDESEEPHIARQSQMRRAEDCPSPPKGGRTPVENDILSQYERLEHAQLVGKQIIAFYKDTDSFILVVEDKGYLKLVAGNDYDEYRQPISNELTFLDLKNLGLLDEGVREQHEEEERLLREATHENSKVVKFHIAVKAIGREKALELLDKTETEE